MLTDRRDQGGALRVLGAIAVERRVHLSQHGIGRQRASEEVVDRGRGLRGVADHLRVIEEEGPRPRPPGQELLDPANAPTVLVLQSFEADGSMRHGLAAADQHLALRGEDLVERAFDEDDMTGRTGGQVGQERGDDFDGLPLRMLEPPRVAVELLDGLVLEVAEGIIGVGLGGDRR